MTTIYSTPRHGELDVFLRIRRREIVAVSLLLLAVGGVVMGLAGVGEYSIEAGQRAAAARDLLEGHSRGRQALVGFLDLGPLPTILVSVEGMLSRGGPGVWSSQVLALLGMLCMGIFVYRRWRTGGVSWYLCLPASLMPALLPMNMRSLTEGSATLFYVSLLVPGMGYLAAWLSERRLHDLAFGGIALGLAMLVYYQTALIILVGVPFVIGAALRERVKGSIEASLIVYLLPALYATALWFGGNWLIMGDPMFHVKHWLARAHSLGSSPLWAALSTYPWGAVVLTGAVANVPLLLWVVPPQQRQRRWAQAIAILAMLGLALASLTVRPTPGVLLDPHALAMSRYLPTRYSNDAYIVVGYPGYEFLKAARPDERELWVHVMQLTEPQIQKALRDYRGRRILLILPDTPTAEYLSEIGLDLRSVAPRFPDNLLLLERHDGWLIIECLGRSGT